MFPAFKEWHVIVEALGSGGQLVILRKGGIAEKHGGFSAGPERFWLFPTRFHAQREKTKPAASRWFSPSDTLKADTVGLRFFADVARHAFLKDWEAVAALDPHHLWTEAAVREKFDWSRPAGLHVFVVRVHRLHQPFSLPVTPEMGGCKSWIELPLSFSERPSSPVLDDAAFARRVAGIPPAVSP